MPPPQPTFPTILFTILNWGLGHATRCIPIIEELQKHPVKIILASEGRSYLLLKKAFPDLLIDKLPAYNIRYDSPNMVWNIGKQLPKIARAVYREHKQVARLVQKHNIDIIISDNRYGCFANFTTNIFITHQLNIKTPWRWLDRIVHFFNKKALKRFDQIWIPDVLPPKNLAGELSIPRRWFPIAAKYLGILSRMKPLNLPQKYDAILLLSGPEPQRTFLEKKLIEQAQQLPLQFLMVKGKPELNKHYFIGENIEVFDFLDAEALNRAIASSGLVVSRSGYSTLMDLVYLEKKALLIPTPGQTEQEYLAEYLMEQAIFYYQKQKDLDLKAGIEQAQNFTGFKKKDFQKEYLTGMIKDFFSL